MAYHFIAIASYYEGGTRIGWHYSSNDSLDKTVIQNFLEKSKEMLGKIDFGIHKLTTDSVSWESVYEKDSFFKDVYIAKSADDFLQLLKKDKEISAIDIAKLFLTLSPVTNLKLQKLIYFTYATYLEKTKRKLFPEKIVAYKYGPVVEEVYHLYKDFGRNRIEETSDPVLYLQEITVPMALAKMAMNENYKDILDTLKEVIELYWTKSASELVSISHVQGGPWDKVYSAGTYNRIIDDISILNYRAKEREFKKRP